MGWEGKGSRVVGHLYTRECWNAVMHKMAVEWEWANPCYVSLQNGQEGHGYIPQRRVGREDGEDLQKTMFICQLHN